MGEGRMQQRPLSLEREARSREASPDPGEEARAGKLEQLYSIRSQTTVVKPRPGMSTLLLLIPVRLCILPNSRSNQNQNQIKPKIWKAL